MNNEIIVVKQLPEIEERLQEVKVSVTERVEQAISLICNEETVKTVKEVRAQLNSEFKQWEERRKEVKTAVMSPYERFEEVYKDCITAGYKKADTELKCKIDNVENELKRQKADEVKAYFNDYLESKGIDFVTFDNARINVTLSASLKSLKAQAKDFIDRICDDLILIDTQEYKDEIMYEYKRFLNASQAITTVTMRHKVLAEERAREIARKEREEAAKAAAEKVEAVAETLAPPVEEEKVFTVVFKVRSTKAQLKVLKEFLENNNYDFE